jgi:hypothetical protein
MYLARDRGKAGIAVYEPALHEESLQRVQLQADLRIEQGTKNEDARAS